MKTIKLYDDNAYLTEFCASVLSCEKTDRGYAVVLDKTAFFPEEGGQSADAGTLDGATVFDVQIKRMRVLHRFQPCRHVRRKGGEQRVFSFARRSEPQSSERQELMQSLAATRVQINQAYSGFDTAHDPELVESFVYEINALQSRYSYLLRRIKELEATV